MTTRSERVAELWVRQASEKYSVGSGYLICQRMVITAAHVLNQSRKPAANTPVMIRFGKLPRLWNAQSIWHADDFDADVALTEITDADWPEQDLPPVRWGRLTCIETEVHADAIGYPEALEQPNMKRESFQLNGLINPGTGFKLQQQYYVTVGNPPALTTKKNKLSWDGMSGAALFSEGLLIGIVIEMPPNFNGKQLIATPIEQVLADAKFVATVTSPHRRFPVLESAELFRLFAPPFDDSRPTSPAALLRADEETVRWLVERDPQLDDLVRWCHDSPGTFEARLIFGVGGLGKTRLARRLTMRMQAEDWVTGWVQAEGRTALPDMPLSRLPACEMPMLLVVDYAETRPDVIRALIESLGTGTGATVRLLMLARSSGQWWRELAKWSGLLGKVISSAQVVPLVPLADDLSARKKAFDEAVTDIAARLHEVPGFQAIGWTGLHTQVLTPNLNAPEYRSILRVQLAALVGLLQASPAQVSIGGGITHEAVLLLHESKYWELRANAAGLADLSATTLASAVTVATLLRPASKDEAIGMLGRVMGLQNSDQDRLIKVAEWLSSLYPASSGRVWDPLQPDRLGEYLVAHHLRDLPSLIDEPFNATRDDDQLLQALHVLARASSEHANVGKILRSLITGQLSRYGPLALRVVVETEQPAYLIAALEEGISNADTADVATLATLAGKFPAEAPVLAEFVERFIRLAISLYQRLQTEDSEKYLLPLALAWEKLSDYLIENKRYEEADAARDIAVHLARQVFDSARRELVESGAFPHE